MDYRDRNVVVTGGTGALGSAVVAELVAAGALCHVPYRDEAEASRFALRAHTQVKLVAAGDLSEESTVARNLRPGSEALGLDPYRRRLRLRADRRD